jgi:hypothetical protein
LALRRKRSIDNAKSPVFAPSFVLSCQPVGPNIGWVFLGLMLAVVILQVIARYVFTSPPF